MTDKQYSPNIGQHDGQISPPDRCFKEVDELSEIGQVELSVQDGGCAADHQVNLSERKILK